MWCEPNAVCVHVYAVQNMLIYGRFAPSRLVCCLAWCSKCTCCIGFLPSYALSVKVEMSPLRSWHILNRVKRQSCISMCMHTFSSRHNCLGLTWPGIFFCFKPIGHFFDQVSAGSSSIDLLYSHPQPHFSQGKTQPKKKKRRKKVVMEITNNEKGHYILLSIYD